MNGERFLFVLAVHANTSTSLVMNTLDNLPIASVAHHCPHESRVELWVQDNQACTHVERVIDAMHVLGMVTGAVRYTVSEVRTLL